MGCGTARDFDDRVNLNLTEPPNPKTSPCPLQDKWKGFPDRLDYGLYWFDAGNRFHKHDDTGSNDFYDQERKKTVIYTHGWELGRIRQRYRATFHYARNDPVNGTDDITVDAWRDAGWNVVKF